MRAYGYVDQKCNATMSVYEHNFQTVTSKLLETKLETNEVMKGLDMVEEKEKAKTSVLQLESRTGEQIFIDDTLIQTSDSKKTSKDVATPKLHEIEPCAPLSNLPEEHCGEVQQFSVQKVKFIFQIGTQLEIKHILMQLITAST